MVTQLMSPIPADTDLQSNYNHWPGRGNLPTSLWLDSAVFRDHYQLPRPSTSGERLIAIQDDTPVFSSAVVIRAEEH
jgi:hypothetical protein